ncbi:MAG: methyltransferase domain-containing protein [Acidobacteriaceae bacterium]
MLIRYELIDNFRVFSRPPELILTLIENHGCRSILEVGSGANPSLSPEYVCAHQLRYVTNDVSAEELSKADKAFEVLMMDFNGEVDPALFGQFDLVFSRMVGEHIQDGRHFHENIFRILKPGGVAVHFLACLGSLPSLTIRMLPGPLAAIMQHYFNPRDDHHRKFRAYYSWALGPTNSMIRRFRSIGYEVVEYVGVYGHKYYSHRFHLFDKLETMKSKLLVRNPVPLLCSYVSVHLRKPA